MNNQSLLNFLRAAVFTFAATSAVQLHANTPIDNIVAVVDSTIILNSELNNAMNAYAQQIRAQGQPLPPVEILRKNVLEQLILRQAQVAQVERYGIQIDENTLNAAVLQVAKQQGANTLAEFQQQLDAEQAGNYALLRTQVAEDLSVNRLRQQQVMSRIKISDRDVTNFLQSPQGQAALGGEVHVLHIRVAPKSTDTTPADLKATADAVKQAFANNNDFQAIAQQFDNEKISVQGADMGLRGLDDIPTELSARVSAVQVGQTTDIIPAPDGLHILKLLERKVDDKRALVPQFLTRHILISPSEVVSPEDAKSHIDQIYQRLQQGADFAALAATYSKDPGSASDGGSLGWVVPGVMVPEFEQVMKNTPAGQYSQPFQSQFGWHILTVEDTRQMDMTEDYQRRMAKQILAERQFDTEVDGWLRELRANAYVDIKDPSLKDPR